MYLRRLLLTALALLAAGAWCGPARAQTFFAESDALREGSALELTFSDLTDKQRVDSGPASTFDDVDSSLRRLDGRFRHSLVAFGATGEARRFRETTDTYAQRDDRSQSAGYGALVLEDLLLNEDQLFFVLSASNRSEEFAYDGYLRQLDSHVGLQSGIVYRLRFFIAGYIQGRESLRLQITDPTLPFVDERYDFDYVARLAGLIFGDPEDFGLLLLWQRKDTPGVPGTAVSLEPGFEELQRAALGLGPFRLEVSQTRFREAFSGDSRRETTERDVSLGVQVGEHFQVSATQKRSDDLQGFTLLGVPTSDRTERTENLLRLSLRF